MWSNWALITALRCCLNGSYYSYFNGWGLSFQILVQSESWNLNVPKCQVSCTDEERASSVLSGMCHSGTRRCDHVHSAAPLSSLGLVSCCLGSDWDRTAGEPPPQLPLGHLPWDSWRPPEAVQTTALCLEAGALSLLATLSPSLTGGFLHSPQPRVSEEPRTLLSLLLPQKVDRLLVCVSKYFLGWSALKRMDSDLGHWTGAVEQRSHDFHCR